MRARRGLHTIVGAVIFTAVMISALGYVSYSLDLIGNFSETVIVEDTRQREKDTESFQITSVKVTSANRLNATIKNTGNIPVTLKTLWVDDQNQANDVKKFLVNNTIPPGGTTFIGPSLGFTMDPATGYDMKLVTQRGNTESFFVNSGATQKIYYQVQVLPEEIPTGFSTTVLLHVVNNMSKNSVLYNIQPQMAAVATVGSPTISLKGSPVPTSYPSLAPGDVAVFRYVYDISGNVGDTVKFTGNVVNGVSNNNATATTTIAQIEQAGTALTALGLSVNPLSLSNVMYLHGETSFTPAGEYRLDGSSADQGGTTSRPSNTITPSYITSNVTSTTNVAAGKYNVSLNYFSNLVPSNVPPPGFAFMMECDDCDGSDDIIDSTGNEEDMDQDNSPTWRSSGGPDGKAYFEFTGPTQDDRFENVTAWNMDSNDYPNGAPDTTMIWARIPSTTDTYMSLIRFGNEGGTTDEYEISFGENESTLSYDNRIYFHYTTAQDPSPSTAGDYTDCVSDAGTDYDNNQWVHIVAVRQGDNQCQLWINGVKQTDEDTTITSGGDFVDAPDYFAIGYDGVNDGSHLAGDIAMVMQWNENALTQQQIIDLYNTNYGTNGTRVNFKIERTISTGTALETLVSETYSLNFHDSTRNSDTFNTKYNLLTLNTTANKYSKLNYTSTPVAAKTFNTNERLKLSISWPSGTAGTQNLPINIGFDDTEYTTTTGNSYMQTPSATPIWPTYNIIDNDSSEVNYWLYNSGPYGAWFQYQGTRMILTNPSGTASYAGLPIQVNETNINEDQDSIFIPLEKYAKIDFWLPSNPANDIPSAGQIAPPGLYNGSVYISGYDEGGRQLLRAIDMGAVRVTD